MTDQSPKTQGIDSIEAVLHTTQAGAILPAARAMFFSLMIGFLALAVCLAVDPLRPYWWKAALLGMGLSMVGSWLFDSYLRVRLMLVLEKVTGRDLNNDGNVADAPIPDPDVKEIHGSTEWLNESGHRQGALDKIVFSEKLAAEFARGVLVKGLSTAERNWKGDGKPFGATDWDNWITHLKKVHAIVDRSDKNFRLGYEITPEGVSYLNGFLSEDEQWNILDKYWDLRSSNSPTASSGA